MKFLAILAALMVIPSIYSENVFKLDITPEEAQRYFSSQNLNVKYAPKLGENPLPTTRDANGDTVYMGRRIPNPGDYVEERYLAQQFHGQDGLGAALFGYKDWNQGRVEAINHNGDVRGKYRYVLPNGKDYVANYWADSRGFHQEDNLPKDVEQSVTNTPAVQRARDEHFRQWNKIAESHARGRDEHPGKWDTITESHARGRAEHFRKWHEIAESHARGSPDPYSYVYNGSPSETQYSRTKPRK